MMTLSIGGVGRWGRLREVALNRPPLFLAEVIFAQRGGGVCKPRLRRNGRGKAAGDAPHPFPLSRQSRPATPQPSSAGSFTTDYYSLSGCEGACQAGRLDRGRRGVELSPAPGCDPVAALLAKERRRR
jgi:hypothetical protein